MKKPEIKETVSEEDGKKILELFDKGFGYGRIGIALKIKTYAVDRFIKANREPRPRASSLGASVRVK